MKKISRAFMLGSIQDYPIYAIPVGDVWYPCEKDTTEMFVKGEGIIHFKKSQIEKKELVGNLPKEWTAEDLKKIGDKYHYFVAMGMLNGWGGSNLFNDGSYGLDYARYEVINMVKFGKSYDEFSDNVQTIGNQFLTELFSNGYKIEGKWLYYKEKLIGYLDNLRIHLLQYFDNCVIGMVLIKPSFDVISFDKMLRTLMVAQDPDSIDKYVSVEDRITYLSSKDVSEKIKNIKF